ncbi:MAG: hypothetical protein ACEQSC_02080, partial [Candidatus Nanopelagicaceae bacterium]
MLPWYFIGPENESIQNILLIVILVGSGILVYLNYKFIKESASQKWLWVVFELVSILSFIISSLVLLV